MLERDGYGRHRPIIFRCDKCDETFNSASPELDVAIERAKRRGWQIEKAHKVWMHICNSCLTEKEYDDGA
jgi:hypothetical protein